MTHRKTRFSPVSPLLASMLLLWGGTALAQPPGGGDGRRGPPPEALEACAQLQPQDACEVQTRDGAQSGTCMRPPDKDDAPLACVPDDAPPPPRE